MRELSPPTTHCKELAGEIRQNPASLGKSCITGSHSSVLPQFRDIEYGSRLDDTTKVKGILEFCLRENLLFRPVVPS